MLALLLTLIIGLSGASSADAPRKTSRPDVFIDLQGIPSPLVLPGPAGSNRLLTALVQGGEASRVWLGRSCDQEGVALVHVESQRWQVNLDSADVTVLLGKRADARNFRICAKTADGQVVESVAVAYRPPPAAAEFAFPWDRATVTVKQRSTKELASGALRITLDDITAGQVLLTLTGPDEQSIVDTRSVAQNQPVPFTAGGREYVLIIDRLTNLLVGDDFAEISIYAADAWARDSIDALIEAVAKSDCKFIRNEQELSGEQFALLLRAKLDQSAERVSSVDEFIDQIASESSTTGKPYEVRCPTGDPMPAAQWLRQHRQKPPCATGREETLRPNARVPVDNRWSRL